jgi:hypothetical protein
MLNSPKFLFVDLIELNVTLLFYKWLLVLKYTSYIPCQCVFYTTAYPHVRYLLFLEFKGNCPGLSINIKRPWFSLQRISPRKFKRVHLDITILLLTQTKQDNRATPLTPFRLL